MNTNKIIWIFSATLFWRDYETVSMATLIPLSAGIVYLCSVVRIVLKLDEKNRNDTQQIHLE